MVGSTECGYYRMMGLEYIGSEFKARRLSGDEVSAILEACFSYDRAAIRDFFTRYSTDEPPVEEPPTEEPPVPPSTDPSQEFPLANRTDCAYWTPRGLLAAQSSYRFEYQNPGHGDLTETEYRIIAGNCFGESDNDINDFINEVNQLPVNEDEVFEDDGEGDDDPILEKTLDPLLVALGAIVIGMVLVYTINTTKEAL